MTGAYATDFTVMGMRLITTATAYIKNVAADIVLTAHGSR